MSVSREPEVVLQTIEDLLQELRLVDETRRIATDLLQELEDNVRMLMTFIEVSKVDIPKAMDRARYGDVDWEEYEGDDQGI